MLHIDNFLRYFIGTLITLILMVNVIYAFNLVGTLGIPFSYQSGVQSYSDKYFGVQSLIDSFTTFFSNNDYISNYQNTLSFWYDLMSVVDLNYVTGFQQAWGASIQGGNSLLAVVSGLLSIFNLLVNVPYVLMMIIYFLLFLFYVLSLIFLFISYACYLLSGIAYSFLPNTTFPTPEIQWEIDPNTGLPVITNSIFPIF